VALGRRGVLLSQRLCAYLPRAPGDLLYIVEIVEEALPRRREPDPGRLAHEVEAGGAVSARNGDADLFKTRDGSADWILQASRGDLRFDEESSATHQGRRGGQHGESWSGCGLCGVACEPAGDDSDA